MEYLSSNLMIAYPFSDHAGILCDPEAWEQTLTESEGVLITDKIPTQLFADASISADVTVASTRLTEFEYNPGNKTFWFTFESLTDLGTHGFTSYATKVPDHGSFVRISAYSVRSFTPFDEGVWPDGKASGSIFIRCVLSAEFLRRLVALQQPVRIVPAQTLVLDLKTLFCRPRTTLPLSFYIADPTVVPAENVVPPDRVSPYITGAVRLRLGSNINIDARSGSIRIRSEAGAGTGVAACAPESNAPKGITVGAKGDLRLVTDACHTLVPHIPSQTLFVFGNCETCCSCERFKNFFTALKRYGLKLTGTWDKLDQMKDAYVAE